MPDQSCQAKLSRALAGLNRFRTQEDGAMLFFSMIVLLIMLFVGGMSIDLMRFEADRTRVMAAADSAALAAASMRQTHTPEEVVENWFEARNLSAALEGVRSDIGLNYRDVHVLTRTTTRSYFMHMLGVNELNSHQAGRAEERRTNVEISMVLDVSGSMDANSRITRLRTSAAEFVDNMLKEDQNDRVSISVVPYSGQVFAGPQLMAQYNITDRHTYSYCVDLPPTVYNQLTLSPTAAMPQHADADTYNSSNSTGGWSTTNRAPSSSNRWCPNEPRNTVRVLGNNRTALMAQIRALEPVGATSIDAGLRWGAALVDPGTRPVISRMIAAGQVDSAFEGRPFDYHDRETLKVIVLMTDGEHWPNEHVNDGYRSGPSPIYRHDSAGTAYYSIYHNRAGQTQNYWVPHKSAWYSHRWAGESCNNKNVCTPIVPSGTGTPLTWTEVWQQMRVQYVAYQFYARALNITYTAAIDRLRTRDGTVVTSGTNETSRMNARLNALCTQLKNQNVAIFGIAFEAPAGGAKVIRDCASTGRFYDVSGLDLQSAFRSIRAQTQTLRLTQ